MSQPITDWLRTEQLPRDLYELLGHPLLDPDRDALVLTLRAANRELLDYQSHPEPAISKRAMALLTELGRCRGILEDPARHQAYVDETAKKLRERFIAERGPLALHYGNELMQWLATAFALPPDTAERIGKMIRGNSEPPQLLPKPGRPKFGAFGTSAPPSVPLPPAAPEIYELEDVAPPRMEPPPPPPRMPARVDPVEQAPRRRSKPRNQPQPSFMLPLAIAGGVLALAAIIAVVVVLTRDEPEKVVRTEPPTPQPQPQPDPEPQPEPKPPEIKKEPPPLPPVKTPEQKKTITPPPVTPPKKIDPPVRPPKPPVEPPMPPVEPPVEPPKKVEPPKFNIKDWVQVQDGKPKIAVNDVYVRLHSVAFQRLTDRDKSNEVSDPLLVIWIEAANEGTDVRRFKKLLDWEKDKDYYSHCQLEDTATGKAIKKPFWFSVDRKGILEIPNWYGEDSANRVIAPGKQALIPLVFVKPSNDAREFTLKIDANRIVGERGTPNEYGTYTIRIREADWKK